MGPRSLVAVRVRKAIALASGEPPADGSDLPEGHVKLFNYCQPPLPPGLYGIEAKQIINSPSGETLNVFNYDGSLPPPATGDPPTVLQNFTVIAPQFQLDPKAINTYYPPDGHVDEGRILPHIVFNDPHIPWDRQAYQGSTERLPQYRIPWMALVVFDPEELTLTAADGNALGIPSFNVNSLSASGAYPMSIGSYLTKINSRVNYDVIATRENDSQTLKDLQQSTDPTSIIFPKKSLVADLFPILKQPAQQILFAHVREANNAGFPDAAEKEKGIYSICVSQRSGPTDLLAPKSQVVHLVSIENLVFTDLGSAGASDRVGMVSLYSWRYLCVPPNLTNFISIMKALADQKQMLKPPEQLIASIRAPTVPPKTAASKTAAQLLSERLSLGYTISRWRVATGDETIAIIRGPLTPIITPQRPSNGDDWPDSSNSGKDYQILDRAFGVMDITYSAAFQVGKLMAISDPVFASALFRFRSLIQNRAASSARMIVNGVVPAHAIINASPATFNRISLDMKMAKSPARISLPTDSTVAPSLTNPKVQPVFKNAVVEVMSALTSAGEDIYSDYKLGKANNSDWEIIHKWISDKLFLSGIPAHYLITDPSHVAGLPTDYKEGDPVSLTPEAFRFFYIDSAWMDCFLDGALSVANHLDPGDDYIRRNIKEAYNVYLRNTIDPAPIKPPVPRYGFFVRSLAVKAIPDLRVTVRCRKSNGPGSYIVDPARTPLVRLTKINDFTILALLDCYPEDIYDITLSQPPHQQRYAAPLPPAIGVPYPVKQVFTAGAPDGPWPTWPESRFPNKSTWYDPRTRCVQGTAMASALNTGLKFSNPPAKFDINLDPAVFALELNDENYQLVLQPPLLSTPGPNPLPDRQLWVLAPDPSTTPVALVTATERLNLDDSLAARRALSLTPAVPPPKIVAQPISTLKPLTPLPPLLNPSGFPKFPPATIPHLPTIPTFPVSPPTTVPHIPTVPANPTLPHVPIIPGNPTVPSVPTTPNPPTTTPPAPAAPLPIGTISPQYILRIHPDYRGPSPLPFFSGSPPQKVYSAQDFVATETLYLPDLLFAVHRDPAAPPRNALLTSIEVIIPITNSSSDRSTADPATPEPLLGGPYDGPGPSMIYNKRVFPLMTLTKAATGNGEELHVTLIPRSAALPTPTPSDNQVIIPDPEVVEASFKLRECRIAGIVTAKTVQIKNAAGNGVEGVQRGVAEIQVVERYLVNAGPAGSQVVVGKGNFEVVKKSGGDTDVAGNEV